MDRGVDKLRETNRGDDTSRSYNYLGQKKQEEGVPTEKAWREWRVREVPF